VFSKITLNVGKKSINVFKNQISDAFTNFRQLSPLISSPILSVDGKMVTNKFQQLQCWKEHFSDLLNRLAPASTSSSRPGLRDSPTQLSTRSRGAEPSSESAASLMLDLLHGTVFDTIFSILVTLVFSSAASELNSITRR